MTARFAIYFMPDPQSALWRFGSSVLGYDAMTATEAPFPSHPAFARPGAAAATEAPRRYGFHGTLTAPFALAEGATEAGLLDHARTFAGQRVSGSGPELQVAEVDEFIALVPADDSSDSLDALAADCVRAFDCLRAPLSDADMARRLASPLTPRERAHLDRWGYPYVFEDFRFHMSLTGALINAQRAELLAAIEELYAPIRAPLDIDAIAVFKQPDRQSRFRVLERLPFRR